MVKNFIIKKKNYNLKIIIMDINNKKVLIKNLNYFRKI